MKRLYLMFAAFLAVVTFSAFAQPELNVYTSRKDFMLRPVVEAYTAQTGVRVNVVIDNEAALMARMQREPATADVFLTQDVAALDRAFNTGLTVPFVSKTVAANVPPSFRGKDGSWTGVSVRTRVIFYDQRFVKAEQLSTYEDLANPKWKGQLCLRTSKKVYNQALVGNIIRNHGVANTERIVRGWVANLQHEVFNDDTLLLQAIDAQECQIGIANAHYFFIYQQQAPATNVRLFYPNQKTTGAHINMSGISVVKDAPNAEQARHFIEWLSEPYAQALYSHSVFEFPTNPRAVVNDVKLRYGQFKRDALMGGNSDVYQVEATKLMDRVGYK